MNNDKLKYILILSQNLSITEIIKQIISVDLRFKIDTYRTYI